MNTTSTTPNRWSKALSLGFRQRCPRCGKGHLFARYLKVAPSCATCSLPLDIYRVDDAPPYFTIVIVGHIIVPAMLVLEQAMHPPEWVHALIWVPSSILLSLLLLPRIKGAVLGWHWAADLKG